MRTASLSFSQHVLNLEQQLKMSFRKDVSSFPEVTRCVIPPVMNSWATVEQNAFVSPVLQHIQEQGPHLCHCWGKSEDTLVFFKNLNDKKNLKEFPTSSCGSVFDWAEDVNVLVQDCIQSAIASQHSATHLSSKAILSNMSHNWFWQPPGGVHAIAKTNTTSRERADHCYRLNPAQNYELSHHIPF